jgi:hypothetical protein
MKATRLCMSEALNRARVVLTSGAVWASTALVRMAGGEDVADGARVAACNSILDRMVSLAQYEELEARVAAIESKLSIASDE